MQQTADRNMNVKKQRLAFHHPYSHYIILQIIHHVWKAPGLFQIFGLKFLNVSVWFFLDLVVMLKSNISVTGWGIFQPCAGEQSAALDCAIYFLRNYTFFYVIFFIFSLSESQRLMEYVGRWSYYKVRIW